MTTSGWQPVRMLDVAPAPAKDVEQDDPLEIIGVTFPSDLEIDRHTARCIVEEYALIGFGADRIRRLFASPKYVALHTLFRRYGPEFVEDSIAAVFPVKESS